jgi:hypothetical protein
MTMVTPNDRTLINVVAHYDREIEGPPLSQNAINRIAEAAKRLLLDELHSAKEAAR